MTVIRFFDAYIGEYNFVRIRDYIGDNSIGADPEEDYNETSFSSWHDIPSEILARKLEYFDIEAGTITIWLEA